MAGRQRKIGLFSLIVVLTNVLGNFALTWGMKRVGDPGVSPLQYIKDIFNPWVTLGIVLLILWMLSRMTLLSWADLSYVLPITSAGYIIQAFIGKFFFNEQISAARWSGTLLIVFGIVLVGITNPHTARSTPAAVESARAVKDAA